MGLVCTTDVCCIWQDDNRECQHPRKYDCKWAIINGIIPEDNAQCDGCDLETCKGAFEERC